MVDILATDRYETRSRVADPGYAGVA